ncbi:MAG: DNA polymerase III subunit delta' [Coriobacteriales bacterium]|jgi:DNA polymerase-3 subunit delta'|nr:DNA polymerase III subunit delta' [Coriobacteriales bacterium]
MSTTQNPSPFDSLVGQPLVQKFLKNAVGTNKTTHAYMFVGPLGAGKTEAAYALAKALLCPNGGCNACDTCIRISHGTHPDVHTIEPLGAASYLADQIHELIHDTTLAPVRADHKVYIITRGDMLTGVSANALLKTLEEPLPDVTFILLARTRSSVLPTIMSRCTVLSFRRIPEREAAALLQERSGCDEADARIALSATGGSVYRAVNFVRSDVRRTRRLRVLEVIESLEGYDDLQILDAVKSLMSLFKEPLDEVKARQAEQLEQGKDALGKGALSRLEQQHKRELTSRERETVGSALDITRSWVRDVMLCATGLGAAITNVDHSANIMRTSNHASEAACVRAMQAIDRAQEQIQYNVSIQLALESMLFTIRNELK